MTRGLKRKLLSADAVIGLHSDLEKTGSGQDKTVCRLPFSALPPTAHHCLPSLSLPATSACLTACCAAAASTNVYNHPDFVDKARREEALFGVVPVINFLLHDSVFRMQFQPPRGVGFWLERIRAHLAGSLGVKVVGLGNDTIWGYDLEETIKKLEIFLSYFLKVTNDRDRGKLLRDCGVEDFCDEFYAYAPSFISCLSKLHAVVVDYYLKYHEAMLAERPLQPLEELVDWDTLVQGYSPTSRPIPSLRDPNCTQDFTIEEVHEWVDHMESGVDRRFLAWDSDPSWNCAPLPRAILSIGSPVPSKACHYQ